MRSAFSTTVGSTATSFAGTDITRASPSRSRIAPRSSVRRTTRSRFERPKSTNWSRPMTPTHTMRAINATATTPTAAARTAMRRRDGASMRRRPRAVAEAEAGARRGAVARPTVRPVERVRFDPEPVRPDAEPARVDADRVRAEPALLRDDAAPDCVDDVRSPDRRLVAGPERRDDAGVRAALAGRPPAREPDRGPSASVRVRRLVVAVMAPPRARSSVSWGPGRSRRSTAERARVQPPAPCRADPSRAEGPPRATAAGSPGAAAPRAGPVPR